MNFQRFFLLPRFPNPYFLLSWRLIEKEQYKKFRNPHYFFSKTRFQRNISPFITITTTTTKTKTNTTNNTNIINNNNRPYSNSILRRYHSLQLGEIISSSSLLLLHPNSLHSSFTLNISRRFASGGRTPTYTELSEACNVLGVEIDCDAKQLKKIYRDLVKKNHPDAGGDAATMSRITVAYDRLCGLSNLEKEQFKVQRNAYRGGSYYSSSSSSNNNNYNRNEGYYRTSTGHPSYNPHNTTGSSSGFYDTPNSEYFRQKAANSHGYYTYQQRNRSYTENPFSTSNPFAFHTQIRRAWSMPMGSIILRGLVLYLGISIILLLSYRRYRDWQHEDGWKMAESLARHEQMSELHRIRQEMNDRIRAAREAAQTHHLQDNYNNNNNNNNNYINNAMELRALQYARRREMEGPQGWPQFSEEKGRLVRRAQDPPGVVLFEPQKEDERRRQLINMQRGREWSERKQGEIEKEHTRASSDGGGMSSTNNNNNNNNNTGSVIISEVEAASRINKIFRNIWDDVQKVTRNV